MCPYTDLSLGLLLHTITLIYSFSFHKFVFILSYIYIEQRYFILFLGTDQMTSFPQNSSRHTLRIGVLFLTRVEMFQVNMVLIFLCLYLFNMHLFAVPTNFTFFAILWTSLHCCIYLIDINFVKNLLSFIFYLLFFLLFRFE